MIKKISLILCFSVLQVFSQQLDRTQLDSLYNLYTFLRGVNPSSKLEAEVEANPSYRKCGFGMTGQIKDNLSSFSVEQQTVIAKLLSRPTLSDELVSPSGFFRIHYTTTGTNAIAYDVNLLAEALDSAYSFEVDYLDFLPPPADGSAGGDGKYDVYVLNLGNLYGQTSSESNVGSTSWTSFLEIDNNFTGFYTTGINAARVTAAHEFHHAIQMGNYAPLNSNSFYRADDLFFYEITSTSMEEFVFDSVNDYYGYMSDYFNNPEIPFKLSDGYSLAIWNIYLKDVFGFEIFKKQWELIPTVSALSAINTSIIEEGSTFGVELNTFGIWTYYTKSRSISGKYFEEAANYPLLDPTSVANFSTASETYDMTIGPVANYFFKINLTSTDETFYSIISNSDVVSANVNSNQDIGFAFGIYNDSNSGSKVINNYYSVYFDKDGEKNWNNTGILNDIVVYLDSSSGSPDISEETFTYPSPFKYSDASEVSIVFETSKTIKSELNFYVFTPAMNLVYYNDVAIERSYTKNSKQYYEFSWDGLDNDKKQLASGVYIFVLKNDSDIIKGKLVIFND